MRILLVIATFLTVVPLQHLQAREEISKKYVEKTIETLVNLEQFSPAQDLDYGCGEDMPPEQPRACQGINHCEMGSKVTNYCFDGLEILNDSLVGSANKALLEIVCSNQAKNLLPQQEIIFGSCQLGEQIIEIDFECSCRSFKDKMAFFCKSK